MQIEISEQKLREYLLNPDHPENCGKAKFFLGCGFRVDCLETFETALTNHLQSSRNVLQENGKFGRKLIVEGPSFRVSVAARVA